MDATIENIKGHQLDLMMQISMLYWKAALMTLSRRLRCLGVVPSVLARSLTAEPVRRDFRIN